jgi:hypothetical protein
MKRSTPMQRTGFARKPDAPFSSFRSAGKELQRSPMRRRARKPKAGDDKRMREVCRDQPCYLRIQCVCIGDITTSVPAHRNEGKGMGLKVPDLFTIPACSACHFEYDQGKRFTREEKRAMWNAGFEEWNPVRAAKLGIQTMEFDA